MYSGELEIDRPVGNVCRILWMNLNMNSSSRKSCRVAASLEACLCAKLGFMGSDVRTCSSYFSPFSKQFDPLLFLGHTFNAFLGRFAYYLVNFNIWLHKFLFHDIDIEKYTLRLWHVAVHQKICQIPEREVDSLQVCFLNSSPGIILWLEYPTKSCWQSLVVRLFVSYLK